MALLFMDGFDHYGSGVNPSDTGKWVSIGGNTPSATTAQARTGTHSLSFPYSPFTITTKSFATNGGFVVGFAIRLSTLPLNIDFLRIREGSIDHLMVATVNGSNVLQVKNGSGTVLATGSTPLSANNWYYLEFKGVIHDVAGSFELRLDGVPEPGCVLTGMDTRNGGTGVWDRVYLTGPNSSTSGTWIDDFYLCDMSGGTRNDFLGGIKIELLMAQPGNGSNVGLTPSTGTDHGALVDEIPANTTDYNSGVAIGVKDTYNLPSPVLTGAILGIQVNVYAAKSDAGARKICTVIRTGATDFDGADQSLLTTYQYFSGIRAQNPGTTLDWTSADLIALEAGAKVTV